MAEYHCLNEARFNPFQVVHPFKHGDIEMNKVLAYTFKLAQKVAQFRPKPFGRVRVYFIYAIPIIVPCPFFGTMADGMVVEQRR